MFHHLTGTAPSPSQPCDPAPCRPPRRTLGITMQFGRPARCALMSARNYSPVQPRRPLLHVCPASAATATARLQFADPITSTTRRASSISALTVVSVETAERAHGAVAIQPSQLGDLLFGADPASGMGRRSPCLESHARRCPRASSPTSFGIPATTSRTSLIVTFVLPHRHLLVAGAQFREPARSLRHPGHVPMSIARAHPALTSSTAISCGIRCPAPLSTSTGEIGLVTLSALSASTASEWFPSPTTMARDEARPRARPHMRRSPPAAYF